MPIMMEVDLRGIDSWKLRLSNPAAVREPMRRFLRKSANVVRPAVMANIPIGATGRARRSVKIKMQAGRYQVRVLSRLFYVRFLEHGTYSRFKGVGPSALVKRLSRRALEARQRRGIRGIPPLGMFARAAQSSQGQVQLFAREMVREILGTLRSH